MARYAERRRKGPISLVILLFLVAGGIYWCLLSENCRLLDPIACRMGHSEYCPNSPPVLSAIAGQTTRIGEPVSLALEAHDPDGDALEFSAQGLPPGLAIAPGSGMITGAPGEQGDYAVSASVSDGRNPPVSRRFRWLVGPQIAPEPEAQIITPPAEMAPPIAAEAYFFPGSAALKDDIAKDLLRPKVEEACAHDDGIERVEVYGFVDAEEGVADPGTLSEQRAHIVADYMRDVNPDCFEGAPFEVQGLSMSQAPEPLTPGFSEFGAQRARVTFYFAAP